jgi:hypothetical protein
VSEDDRQQSAPGGNPVGAWTVAALSIYLVLVAVLTLDVLFAAWAASADLAPAGTTNNASATDAGVASADGGAGQADGGTTSKASAADGGVAAAPAPASHPSPAERKAPEREAKLFFFWKVPLTLEMAIALMVLASGALGGLVHALRSIGWYVGNRYLYQSWVLRYLLLPLVGALMALLFYLVVRGGLVAWNANGPQVNPFGFAAVGAIIGMFSEQAALKLKEVADTLFVKPPQGNQALPQGDGGVAALKIADVLPQAGAAAGGDQVTIHGLGFKSGASVTFGGAAAPKVTVTNTTTLDVVTPPHDPGSVDVAVTVGASTVSLKDAFTYK